MNFCLPIMAESDRIILGEFLWQINIPVKNVEAISNITHQQNPCFATVA